MGRYPKHDYRGRCIYHVTLSKATDCPVFSLVEGLSSQPVVVRTSIGAIIEKQILELPNYCPSLQILQYVIMPDHIHLALFVRQRLPRVLGRYIGMLKVKCGQQIRTKFPEIINIFTPDFHDRFLRSNQSLTAIIEYIRQNPYRLLVRRENPHFFRRVSDLSIGGNAWQAYGNLQLLDNPIKSAVIVHRADSESVFDGKCQYWKYLSENGGVLVSAFIAPREKVVRNVCEALGGRMILLLNRPFSEREKPSAHDFELCAEGRLLILAPMTPLAPGRKTFLYLNSVAEIV